ncbi:hypothetical protein N9D42_00385 [Candidatus Thioglobus sp.]|nr:hypothetical protein [Candidatus Thioglobus sp.]
MQSKLTEFLYQNIIAFLVISLFTFLNPGETVPFIGNMIWLQIGAISLCYLLFGYKIFLGALIAVIFTSHGFGFDLSRIYSISEMFEHFVGAFSPLFAITSMRFFKLSNFFEDSKLVFQHLIFLGILTAFYNTILTFFVYSYFEIKSGGSLVEPFSFIKNYLLGDILGSLIVLFFAALVVVPGIRYFAPKHVPLEDKIK